jgi:hypothetical protein
MRKHKGKTDIGLIGALVIIAVAIAGVVGWVLNIVTLAHSDFSAWTGLLVLRCLGVVVPPLGAVLGYL